MKKILLILLFITNKIYSQKSVEVNYLSKYKYTKQKDSANKNSKFIDIMYLEIGKKETRFYSYLKQLGIQNGDDDIKAKMSIEYVQQNLGRYNSENESEIILVNYKTKQVTVKDKLTRGGKAYFYFENITAPVWNISSDTIRILNLLCQKATTNFKGRYFTAWFAKEIAYPYGPWLFSGLPGLILKVEDSTHQFIFECTGLDNKMSEKSVLKEYQDCKIISKKGIKKLKKLKEVDRSTFDQLENPNLLITTTNNISGASTTTRLKIKPYNPIDIADK